MDEAIKVIENEGIFEIKYKDVFYIAAIMGNSGFYIADLICSKYNGKFNDFELTLTFGTRTDVENAKEELDSYYVLCKLMGRI